VSAARLGRPPVKYADDDPRFAQAIALKEAHPDWTIERIPMLLATPAAVHWISAEPLLGPVDLKAVSLPCCCSDKAERCDPISCLRHGIASLDWVVVGGESGPSARPMRAEWARALRDQCTAAGVAFHFKQWGAFSEDGSPMAKVYSGRKLDGRTWDEWPDA
jgi:protein gp37